MVRMLGWRQLAPSSTSRVFEADVSQVKRLARSIAG